MQSQMRLLLKMDIVDHLGGLSGVKMFVREEESSPMLTLIVNIMEFVKLMLH